MMTGLSVQNVKNNNGSNGTECWARHSLDVLFMTCMSGEVETYVD
jgi:hypothetical protein